MADEWWLTDEEKKERRRYELEAQLMGQPQDARLIVDLILRIEALEERLGIKSGG